MNIPTAICKKCGEEKPHTQEFFRSQGNSRYTGKRLLTYTCKLCMRKPEHLKKPRMQKDGLKRCPVCKQWLPATTEHFYASQKDGLQSRCKPCNKASQNQWANQPENREKLNRKHREAYAGDPQRHRDAALRFYRSPKGKSALWEYRTRRPEAPKATYANRRAKVKGIAGKLTADGLKAQFDRQHGRCYYCGIDLYQFGSGFHQEHMTPLCRGGENTHSNVVLSCPDCNRAKSRRTAEEFTSP